MTKSVHAIVVNLDPVSVWIVAEYGRYFSLQQNLVINNRNLFLVSLIKEIVIRIFLHMQFSDFTI